VIGENPNKMICKPQMEVEVLLKKSIGKRAKEKANLA
jgi:hypothetical protein